MSAVAAVINAELFKALRKRRTLLLAGLWWVVLPLLTLLLARTVQNNLGGTFVDQDLTVRTLVQALASPAGLARVNLVAPALLSPPFYMITVALFAALLIGDERAGNMWKTVLTAQPLRVPVLVGKFAVAMILLAGLMAGALLAGILFGSVGMLFLDTTFDGPWLALVGYYLLQWAFAFAAVAFAFLLIFLVRNVALGIVMVFFLPALIEGIYSVVRATIGIQPLTRFNAFFQALELQVTFENLPQYFFTSNLYAPARRPLTELVALIGGSPGVDGDVNELSQILMSNQMPLEHSAIVMLVYGTVFLALLFWLFLSRDFD